MNKYNEISFIVDNPGDEDETWRGLEHFKQMCEMLVLNNYEFKVVFDGMCAIIQFNHNPREFGGARLEWVDEEESINEAADY